MKCYSLVFFIVLVALTDGRYFRNDYTFSSDAKGWIKFHMIPATWDEARLRCFYEGSVLASPLDEGLRKAMTTAMGKTVYVFTGTSATFSKGDYFSIEGDALESFPHTWSPKQPDNTGDEQCIAMAAGGSLADVPCSRTLPYICYKKISQNIPSVNQCGTVDPEYTFEARTGHCYKFHKFGQAWSRAFMACSAEGAHLAIINSEVEAQALKELAAKYPSSKVTAKHKDIIGLGFHDWSQHGVFMTVHGESLQKAGYEMWAGGQPDNATTGEYCGSMFRDARLNDIWCEEAIPFLCEKMPGSLLDNASGSTEEALIDERQGAQ